MMWRRGEEVRGAEEVRRGGGDLVAILGQLQRQLQTKPVEDARVLRVVDLRALQLGSGESRRTSSTSRKKNG